LADAWKGRKRYRKGYEWSKEDDAKLLAAVKKYQGFFGCWKLIENEMGNRTARACMSRYSSIKLNTTKKRDDDDGNGGKASASDAVDGEASDKAPVLEEKPLTAPPPLSDDDHAVISIKFDVVNSLE
jgi:Myb-like DNA-binding domain